MNTMPYQRPAEHKEIVFIRHAESQANIDGVWNGRTDGPLSDTGEASLDDLSQRLVSWRFDRAVASPLERTRQTAAAFFDGAEVDERFIEIDLGRWEGMRISEIQESDGDALNEAIRTRTKPMGGTGETLEEAGRRALDAVDSLAESMSDTERVAVVTHGGFMQAVLHRHLAGGEHRAHSFTANTAITRVVWQFGQPRLASFNDTGHLGPRSGAVQTGLNAGHHVIAFVRHGRTRANVEGRWQGRGDWDLDETGLDQAAALSEWYGQIGLVYTSPLKRAATTAGRIAANGVIPIEDFKEIHMGKWEGMTTDEILAGWSELMEHIFRDGVDLRRGETGESWGELTARFANAVGDIERADGEPTAVVAHGGAIRSYISSLTTNGDSHAESLFTPANTSVSHVGMTERGPEILDYSVAPHLESLQ
ncbi:MAG: histidine phosphatase family protein [Actinomycetota bacterium]|nr:histidine phosphatase family protein [Actinomycetota bacterium]